VTRHAFLTDPGTLRPLGTLAMLGLVLGLAAHPVRAQESVEEPVEEAPAEEGPAVDALEAPLEEPLEPPADAEALPEEPAPIEATSAPADEPSAPAEADTADEIDDLSAPAPEPAEAEAPVAEATEEAVAETAEEAAEEPAAEEAPPAAAPPAPLPWRNSFLSLTPGATANTFCPGCQLSYNPTVTTGLAISPRWYFTPRTFLLMNFGLNIEWTDTDFNALNREVLIGDPNFELRHTLIWEGFVFQLRGRVAIPASRASLAARRILQLGAGANIIRPIPEIGLTVVGVVQYRHWLASSNVPLANGGGNEQACTVIGGTFDPVTFTENLPCDQFGGPTSTRGTFVYGAAAIWAPLPGFNVTGSAFWLTNQGFGLQETNIASEIDTASPDEEILLADDQTHIRNLVAYSISLGYEVLPWMQLSVGISNAAGLGFFFNPGGGVRSPFSPDTQLFVNAQFQLDAIYEQVAGSGEDDGLTPEERQRRRQGLASGPSQGATF
jgi:hypothetical protein